MANWPPILRIEEVRGADAVTVEVRFESAPADLTALGLPEGTHARALDNERTLIAFHVETYRNTPYVCECEGCERRPYHVVGHDDSEVLCFYCDECAYLAGMDWNGETESITPLDGAPLPVWPDSAPAAPQEDPAAFARLVAPVCDGIAYIDRNGAVVVEKDGAVVLWAGALAMDHKSMQILGEALVALATAARGAL